MSGQMLTMRCWKSTDNPDGKGNEPIPMLNKMMYGAMLANHLQKSLGEYQYALTSASEDASKNEISISVCYPSESANHLPDISGILNQHAADLGIHYKAFTAQQTGYEGHFSDQEVKNIKEAATLVSEGKPLNGQEFRSVMMSVLTSTQMPLSGDQDRLPSILINSAQLDALRSANGDGIQDALKEVLKAPGAAVKLPETAWQTLWMIAKGVFGLYGSAQFAGLLIPWLGTRLQALATAAMGYGLLTQVAVIVAIFASLLFVLKQCGNLLLVVNNTKHDVKFIGDNPKNGDRTSYTPEIPKTDIPGYHAAGWYVYEKNKIKGYVVGFFGSAFGTGWTCGDRKFSIGMDCPITIMGGRNSIEIRQDDDYSKACDMALGSACTHGWVNGPGFNYDVKIASTTGNINWGVSILDEY